MTKQIVSANLQESNTQGILTIESEHEYMFAGRVFDFHVLATATNAFTYDVVMDISAVPNFVHLSAIDVKITGGPARIFLYEDAQTTGGTTISVNSLNRLSANTSNVTIKTLPTAVTLSGSEIHFDFIPNANNVGGSNSPSDGTGVNHTILKPNTKYILRIINNSGQNESMSIGMTWFEQVGRTYVEG